MADGGRSDGMARPILHDANYTLGLRPSSKPVHLSPTTKTNSNFRTHLLSSSILDHIDIPIYAVAADGSLAIANEACKTFSIEKGLPLPNGTESPLWINPEIINYDETFTRKIPWEEDTLYRAAIKGEHVAQHLVGWRSRGRNGVQLITEVMGTPVFDDAGTLIGGFIRFSDVSDREQRLQMDVLAKGEEYFRQICDTMPQLVWSTQPDGYHG